MNYRKLLEKYMREIVDNEGTSLVPDLWDGGYGKHGFSFKEHAFLLKLREKIFKEQL